MKDYYKILNISSKANETEIMVAYLKLVKKYHPDKNNNSSVFTDFMNDINEAYETLSDSDKRKDYDTIHRDLFDSSDIGNKAKKNTYARYNRRMWLQSKMFLLFLVSIVTILALCYGGYRLVLTDSIPSVKDTYTRITAKYRINALTKKALKDNSDAMADLSELYVNGTGVPINHKLAVKWALQGAMKGNADAQNTLGYCYFEGKGITQSYKESVKWYRLAAEQGNSKAQNNLGGCYYNGDGVTQEYNEAARWFRKSAQAGYLSAQYNLAVCYLEGIGVAKDPQKGFKIILHISSEKGVDQYGYQYMVGRCYALGEGVTRSYPEALKWFRKSAYKCKIAKIDFSSLADNPKYPIMNRLINQAASEQGDVKAQYLLGLDLASIGKHQDAVKWYRMAAKQGNAGALRSLGNHYYEGSGVIQSDAEAYYYYLLANSLGYEASDNDGMDYLVEHLSHGEKQSAQKRANKWLKAYQKRIK